jgi:hypothetical protein
MSTPTADLDAMIVREKAKRGADSWPHTLVVSDDANGGPVTIDISIVVPRKEWDLFVATLARRSM